MSGEAQLNSETKSLVETRAAQSALLNQGADLLAADGLLQAERASGAAIFARRKDTGGMYYEDSLRAGRTKADYSSRDFTGYEGTTIGYDTDSNYLGAHLGLGKAVNLAGNLGLLWKF